MAARNQKISLFVGFQNKTIALHGGNPENCLLSIWVTAGDAQMEGKLVVGETQISNLKVQQMVFKKKAFQCLRLT